MTAEAIMAPATGVIEPLVTVYNIFIKLIEPCLNPVHNLMMTREI